MVYRLTSYFGGPICFILCFGRIFHPSFVPFNPYLIYYIVVSHKKKKNSIEKDQSTYGVYNDS